MITSRSGTAIELSGASNSVTNTATGVITSDGDYGIRINGDDGEIINAGLIQSESSGIWANGTAYQITNSGAINSDGEGIFSQGNLVLTITGTITSRQVGIFGGNDGSFVHFNSSGDSTAGVSEDGIRVLEATDGLVSNSGNIIAGDDGIEVASRDALVTNTGSIIADDYGILLSSGLNSADNQVTNEGSIVSSFGSGIFVYSNANIINSGTISSESTAIVAGFAGVRADIVNSGTVTSDSSCDQCT